jgi:hypothetical protein
VKERLKLVESFDELRVGMIVVITACAFCDGTHRGILTDCNDELSENADGSVDDDMSWDYSPTPECCGGPDIVSCFSADAVEDGRIYRVLDGLEDTQQTIERTPRKRTARV